jgi:hypothetical protein
MDSKNFLLQPTDLQGFSQSTGIKITTQAAFGRSIHKIYGLVLPCAAAHKEIVQRPMTLRLMAGYHQLSRHNLTATI